ncbi:MAG: proliferating cell nuclear antigen (pcna) [Candidatus Marsarchaeota archaeon]|nr:proliferating cell nuclear antigen (pcna) [Candidatus Marsarchaeota archaeon]
MFEIKLDNAKYWKDCVAAIVSLVDEGSFAITKEGISLRAIDPSCISMVFFSMPNKAFSKFNIEKNTSIGLNLDNLNKILSRTREGESLVMKDADNKLSMEFIGPNSRRRYKLQMIEVTKMKENEPSVTFDAAIEMSGDPLKDIIKDASMISSYISFKASKGQFSVSARGDSGELEELHDADGSIMKKIEASQNAEATFNLEFLENMVRSCPTGNNINIALKSNEPLKLSYKIGDSDIVYYLAQYMEE